VSATSPRPSLSFKPDRGHNAGVARATLFLIAGLLIGLAVGASLGRKAGRDVAEVGTSSSSPQKGSCDHDPGTFRCVKFEKNYDGDTITVQIPGVHPLLGRDISVRVYGIDTPEMKGKSPCEGERAKEARDLVRSLLSGAKNIELRNLQRDKYFRILAEVVADGVSVREKLLGAKLAYPYDGGTKAKVNWCQLASRP
jgi:micrococcal nuclease